MNQFLFGISGDEMKKSPKAGITQWKEGGWGHPGLGSPRSSESRNAKRVLQEVHGLRESSKD